jgi:hypothetical protein
MGCKQAQKHRLLSAKKTKWWFNIDFATGTAVYDRNNNYKVNAETSDSNPHVMCTEKK